MPAGDWREISLRRDEVGMFGRNSRAAGRRTLITGVAAATDYEPGNAITVLCRTGRHAVDGAGPHGLDSARFGEPLLRKIPFLLLLAPTVLFADEVFLKGAGSISGQIVEQTATMVTINIGGGTMGVPMANVDHIVKARCPLDDYDDRAKKLGPQDADGWRQLGRWATQQGLSAQATQAYQHLLTLVPNDPEAEEALGFVLVNGQWMTEEESYRARGYVQYDGEWMTPAQAQTQQQNDAAQQARQDADKAAFDAETAKMQADAQAAKAAEKAADEQRRADEEATWGQPLYWGGYGYGVTSWPSTAVVTRPPVVRTP